MADRAEAAGVPVDSTCRGAALRGLRDATKLATGEIPPDRTGNTDRAALARGSLGQEIREAREARRLSRRDLMNLIHVDLSAHGFAVGRGWGPAQAQQWELGKSAPKMVEPIIRALGVEGEQADRWRRWWALARRGVEGSGLDVDVATALEQRMAEAEVESLERIAELEQELVEQGIELP
jgi:transcriptional regulator with XRE-family HTH domain